MHRASLLIGAVSVLVSSSLIATPAAAQSFPAKVVKSAGVTLN